ncbi:helix-turn-helix domain-containing protein [Streptosporangium lutulentum]
MVRLPLTPVEVERGQRLGALLRRARGERSMLETALDARVSPETLRKIETGRVATPAFPTIAAIADALGLSSTRCGPRSTSPNVMSNRPAPVTTHASGWPRKP